MSTLDPEASGTRIPRGLMILMGLAAATIAVAGIRATAGIIGPVLLALVLIITVSPIRTWVEKRGAPRWLAATVAILAVYLILVAMALALVVSAAKLAQLVPEYSARLTDLARNIGEQLANLGVSSDQIDSMVSSLDFGKVFSIATNILSGTFSVVTNVFLIATLAIFLALDAGNFPRHLQEAREHRPAVVEAIESFVVGTRRYVAVSTVFGLIVAVIDTIALAIMGIPAAIVWGVLAFVTNYIPNIGFVIGLVPPALLALLDGGWTEMIAVIIVYSVINVGIQSGIQPKIVGDALGLSTTLTFVSLLFWAWVLGPLGALLAIPLTLLAKAMFIDVDPNARWIIPLMSGKDHPAPAESP